jgi:hypothetical protein
MSERERDAIGLSDRIYGRKAATVVTSGPLPSLPGEYRITGSGLPKRCYVAHVRGSEAVLRRVSWGEWVLGRLFGWLHG